jgi:hypothetical protein
VLVGLSFDMLPAKEPSINGPRTGADHRSGTAECCQDYRNPGIAAVGESDPELNDRDQCSNDWGPKANQEEYGQTCTNDLRDHQRREGGSREIDDPESNEQQGSQNSLKQQSYTWPAAGEGRKQSLQKNLPPDRREIAPKPERLKAGGLDPTFGGDPAQ